MKVVRSSIPASPVRVTPITSSLCCSCSVLTRGSNAPGGSISELNDSSGKHFEAISRVYINDIWSQEAEIPVGALFLPWFPRAGSKEKFLSLPVFINSFHGCSNSNFRYLFAHSSGGFHALNLLSLYLPGLWSAWT